MSSAKSTAYRVELTERALLDLEAIYSYIEAAESQSAYRWYDGLEETVFSLKKLPQRGIRTPEDAKLRQILYGNKPHFYRIIYSIDLAEKRVIIIHIRHGAQDAFKN